MTEMDFELGPVKPYQASKSTPPGKGEVLEGKLPGAPPSLSTVLTWIGVVAAVVAVMGILMVILRRTRETKRREEERILDKAALSNREPDESADRRPLSTPGSTPVLTSDLHRAGDSRSTDNLYSVDDRHATNIPSPADNSTDNPAPSPVPMYPVGGRQRRPSLS